tara:strand:- start:1636 stop:3051 length:1416 start_codon:yes stop_codon:yes gene_type:complete
MVSLLKLSSFSTTDNLPTISFSEKRNIAIGLENTPSSQLEEIITLIHRYEPAQARRNPDKTWDIDLNRLSDTTLRLIDQIIKKPRPNESSSSSSSSNSKRGSITPKLRLSPRRNISSAADNIARSSPGSGYKRRRRSSSTGPNLMAPQAFGESSMFDSSSSSSSNSNSNSRSKSSSSSSSASYNHNRQLSLTRNDSLDMLLSAESPAGVVIYVNETWACQNCTYDNEYTKNKCVICGDIKPIMPSSTRMLPGQDAPFKITATVAAGDSTVDEDESSDEEDDDQEKEDDDNDKEENDTSQKGRKRVPAKLFKPPIAIPKKRKRKSKATKTSKKTKKTKKTKTTKTTKTNGTKSKKLKQFKKGMGLNPTSKGRNGGTKGKHSCQYCGKSFRYTTNWRSHERSHTGEKIFVCDWKQCTKKFAHLSSLQAHISKHKGIKPFKCIAKNCRKKFANQSNRNRHLRKIHGLDTTGNKI